MEVKSCPIDYRNISNFPFSHVNCEVIAETGDGVEMYALVRKPNAFQSDNLDSHMITYTINFNQCEFRVP